MNSVYDNYRISVEMQPMGEPKAVGFGVFKGSAIVAYLSLQQVEEAVGKYRAMNTLRELCVCGHTRDKHKENSICGEDTPGLNYGGCACQCDSFLPLSRYAKPR